MTLSRAISIFLLPLILLAPMWAQAVAVDLELILAVDVSRSMDMG